jgi:hypothetical protein
VPTDNYNFIAVFSFMNTNASNQALTDEALAPSLISSAIESFVQSP